MLAILLIAIPVLLIAFALAMLATQVWVWRRARAVDGWQTVQGRVVCSEVGVVGGEWQLHPLYRLLRIALLLSGRSIAGPRYEPRVAYEYVVDGHTCVGRRVRMGSLATSQSAAAGLTAGYPVGKEVTVHYNPERPADAVLETGLDGANYVVGTVVSVLVLCFGIGVGLWIARGTTSHTEGVYGVAFSPNGARVVSVSSDLSIRMWETQTGREIWRQQSDFFPFTTVAYSPAGDVVASGDSSETIQLWDAATGTPLRALTSPTRTINALAFSPDGRHLVSASGWDFNNSDPGVALWEVATGNQVRLFTGHRLEVNAVAFSADGQTIATASSDKTIRLWEVATGRELRSLAATGEVHGVALSPDGQRVAGKLISSIVVWDLVTDRQKSIYSTTYAIAFSPDGQVIASGGGGYNLAGQLTLFDSATGAVVRSFSFQGDEVKAIAFDAAGARIVTGGGDKTVRVWEVATGKEQRNFRRAMWAP